MISTRKALFALAATASLTAAGYGVAQTAAQTAAPAAAPAAAAPATAADLKPGTYTADGGHSKVTWSVIHNGFSTYSGQFADVQGELVIGATPQASTLSITVPIARIITGSALDSHSQGPNFFDVAQFATATFKSTSVTVTGANTGRVTGDLTLKGVTKPVTLDVVFRKGATHRGRYVLGFDATGKIKRSDFGVSGSLPGVSDEVDLAIGAQFRSAAAPAG